MRKTQNISITLPGNLIEFLNKIQEEEAKSCSAIVSEAVKLYFTLKEYDMLVEKFSAAAKKAGIITEEDIDNAVHEVKCEELRRNKSRR